MCFAVTENGLNPNVSCTVLPWDAEPNMTQPRCELTIAHLGSFRHFIRLNLDPGFPVPPICTLWYNIATNSVNGWDLNYQERRNRWDLLTNTTHETGYVDLSD